MKKLQLFPFFLFILCFGLQAQVLLDEDFESGNLPSDWSIQTLADDGGWLVGTPAAISSQFWPVQGNGSTNIAGTNDDACNCDKSEDYLVTPALDFSTVTSPVVQFDMYFQGQSFQGNTEQAFVEVSLNGTDWQAVQELEGEAGWIPMAVNLDAYAGEPVVYIGFRYQDNGGYLYGFAVDNVSVQEPFAVDASLLKLNGLPFGEEARPFPLTGEVYNNGTDAITEFELGYSIGGGAPTTEVFTGVNIAPFTSYEFEMPTPWTPDAEGTFEVTVEITSVNGGTDENPDNNSDAFETQIYPFVTPPNRIEEFLATAPVVTELDIPDSQLDKPTDLEFFPILALDELWVINERNENSGGSTLTLQGASEDDPVRLHRVDGNAWHFMSLPTGIAFSSDNFNFANSPGVRDANHSGGTFTGPSLWSSDPEIYAQPSGGNGSHLDMLHGSPFSMGIAHEVDNVFWIYDDWNSDIVRYDFVEDHGPGADDHSDAIVRRYRDTGIEAESGIPNHMILDKETGWLYIVDNGNDRVFRLDINSGSVGNNLPLINEPLAEHSEVVGYTTEVIIDAGLDQPCGIEIMENRLLVGDHANGDIIVYDMDNGFLEIGRIPTGEPGLTGITIGPDGSIWYTNRTLKTLSRMEPGVPSSTEEEVFASQITLSPNPTSGSLFVRLPQANEWSEITLGLSDLAGKNILWMEGVGQTQHLDVSGLANGIYLLSIQADGLTAVKKVVVER